jgi:hypothetical protein
MRDVTKTVTMIETVVVAVVVVEFVIVTVGLQLYFRAAGRNKDRWL